MIAEDHMQYYKEYQMFSVLYGIIYIARIFLVCQHLLSWFLTSVFCVQPFAIHFARMAAYASDLTPANVYLATRDTGVSQVRSTCCFNYDEVLHSLAENKLLHKDESRLYIYWASHVYHVDSLHLLNL